MSVCQELEELYPAYALDAITSDERSRVEAHLARCPACVQLVDAYCSVGDALALSVPLVEPPANLKSRVLAATAPRPVQRAVPSTSFFEQLQFALTKLVRSSVFAGAMLVWIVGLAVWNWSLQSQLAVQVTRDMAEQREFLNTVAYSEGMPRRMQATAVAPDAVGRLYVAPELHTLALVVYDLPMLDANRAYQLWLIDPNGDRTSGGTFTVDDEGTGWLMVHLKQPVSDYQGVGITIEPRGGSPKPTGDRVLSTTLRD